MNKFIFIAFIITMIFLPYAEGYEADFILKINEIYENISVHYEIDGEISFVLKEIKIGSAEAKRYPFGNYVITLDYEKLADAGDIELTGMLAHELAHLESYSEMNFPGFLLFGVRYGLSEDFRTKTERETDMKAREKGYGEELLAFREYRLATGSGEDIEVLNENYLSIDEIKVILRKNSEGGI